MNAHMIATDRNRQYADTHTGGRPALVPTLQALVLCCADHRADPAHVLGLEPNDAVVFRNPGGRVTTSFVQSMAVLATVGAINGITSGFELIVMHHTDCGLSHLSASEHAAVLAPMFGIEPDQVADRHIGDPDRAVAMDVDLLRRNPRIPDTLVVSGIVYDVDTGAIRTVVPRAPLG